MDSSIDTTLLNLIDSPSLCLNNMPCIDNDFNVLNLDIDSIL
jgi:hypothetical protein